MFQRSLIVLLLLAAMISPVIAQEANLTDGCVSEYDAGQDYFPDKIETEYTDGFSVEYFNNYKVVTVNRPWPGAGDGDSVTYVLVQCGTPAPEGYDNATLISVPVNTFAAMSTTYLPYVEIYGLIDKLVAVDTASTISTPGVVAKAQQGELAELSPNYELNLEVSVEVSPELTMFYGFGFETDSYLQLQNAGLTIALNGEFAELDPLSRAEWGKYLALFFNKEAEAEAAFEEMTSHYDELVTLAASVEDRPTVFVNSPFDGTWYMAGGGSYFARLLADAGSDYLWADDPSTGTLFLDFEAVYEIAESASFWINVDQFWFTLNDALAADERYADFAAFADGNVWSNNLAVNENFGNDFYESGAAYPDRILADLIAIFHPDLLPDHEFVYYRQLAGEN